MLCNCAKKLRKYLNNIDTLSTKFSNKNKDDEELLDLAKV